MPLVDGGFHPKILCQGRLCHRLCAPYGLQSVIITGGRGATLDHRPKNAGNHRRLPGLHGQKYRPCRDFFARHGLDPANVIYMGDIPDLECMSSRIPVCPSDAASEVIEACATPLEFAGGTAACATSSNRYSRARDDWARDSRGMHTAEYRRVVVKPKE